MWVYAWSEFCMDRDDDPSLRFFTTKHVNDQVLGNVFEGLFRTPSDKISYRVPIVGTSCSQLPDRSGILCLLVEVVYRTCGLKLVYPTIILTFPGIIVKVKLCEWFCLQISDTKYFPLLPKALWSSIISCYSILFSNMKQKGHNIIISRVMNSRMLPIHIETPYTYLWHRNKFKL